MGSASTERLMALLDEERSALIAGDYDALQQLGPEKWDLLNRLPASDLGDDDLRPVARRIERNQKLIKAAILGARSARSRIDVLHELSLAFESYDRSGQRARIGTNTHVIERKA